MDEKGIGDRNHKKLKTMPFTLAINVTTALFYTRNVVEKHEKVEVLESKKKMVVACWQWLLYRQKIMNWN